MKQKVGLSLSTDLIDALKDRAPAGNLSGFVEGILRAQIELKTAVNGGSRQLDKLIEKYRGQKMQTAANERHEGFNKGRTRALSGYFSLAGLRTLEGNLEPGMLSWLDTEEKELSHALKDEETELRAALSNEFIGGYWQGVISVYREIKTRI